MKALRYINAFSLDIALGAAFSAIIPFKLFLADINPAFWFVLPATVWVIYTVDHLIDAFSMKENCTTLRHKLHFKNFKLLSALTIGVLLLTLMLTILFLPQEVIVFGLFTGIITCLHLFIVWSFKKTSKRYFFKELLISIVYSLGIWGPLYLTKTTQLVSIDTFIISLTFFLTALSNLLIFSTFEQKQDESENALYLPSVVSNQKIKRTIIALCIITLTICIVRFFTSSSSLFYGVIAIMNVPLISVLINSKMFEYDERYRVISDAVFIIPGIVFLI